MAAKRWAYEDMEEGRVFELGSHTMDAAEIIAFATLYDPQPMHLDEKAGKASMLGGLAASGWHTSSVVMRMSCDGLLLDSTSQGAPGIDTMRWKAPVLAGDTITARVQVLSRRPLKSRPGMGIVHFRHSADNQNGVRVLEFENPIIFAMRDHGGTA